MKPRRSGIAAGPEPGAGQVDLAGIEPLDVPRDRAGSVVVLRPAPKKSQRRRGLDEMVISLWARGMTIRDTQHRVASATELRGGCQPNSWPHELTGATATPTT